MTKDVFVSISGLHSQDTGSLMAGGDTGRELIERCCEGTYYFKNGKHYVFFEEREEESKEVIKTQIRWQGAEEGAEEKKLEVVRKGGANVYLTFEEHKKCPCTYETAYGKISMEAAASFLSMREEAGEILLRADYTLEDQGTRLTDSAITIRIWER